MSHFHRCGLLGLASGICLLAVLQAGCSVSYPQGVLVDQIHYDKTVFAQAPNMNNVSDLRQGDFDGDAADEILAVGGDGIHLLGLDGKEKRFTPFRSPESPYAVKVVESGGDGKRRFLGSLPNAAKTALFDDAGAIAWTAAGGSYDGPVAADLDGDGRPEVLAKQGSGLVVLSLDGTLVRQLAGAGSPLFFGVADMDGAARTSSPSHTRTRCRSSRVTASRWRTGRRLTRSIDSRLPARLEPIVP